MAAYKTVLILLNDLHRLIAQLVLLAVVEITSYEFRVILS